MPSSPSTLTPQHDYLSGNDAIVHVMLEQQRRDQAAGLSTAGFISGYRGSPLGTLDMALWSDAERLKAHHIHFTPGVNEELAATAVWGTQYVSRQEGAFAGAKFDGVFGIWYGKGPGVDRSGDALKHGNFAGTSPMGGVLALAGDDHAAKSSTTAHQSDPALIAAGIPILAPCDVQDIVHLGLHGLAMSRFSGCWVGLKLVTDVMETSATADLAHAGPKIPVYGTPARASRIQDPPRLAEERLMRDKLPAVLEYARTHELNRVRFNAAHATRGLVAAGKCYGDLVEALSELGLDDAACERLGLRILKLDMVWPIDPQVIASFAAGLHSVLVIEEKRGLIEDQLKAALYDLEPFVERPKLEGKSSFPNWGELSPTLVGSVLARWLGLQVQAPESLALTMPPIMAPRMPSFCSGCPHSISTRVPEGSRALAGIGCHGMATFRQPGVTTSLCQMGGEGAMWIGQAPFMETPHVFANMGDGTYFHSGLLAIRAAVAAKVRMTYKILVNGFVSMTGGQPIEGELSVFRMVQSLEAEGVRRIVVVTDDVSKYPERRISARVPVLHRSQLEAVQRELRNEDGVTALIYEQPCATERRRLRKRGSLPDPAVRTFINPEVCEGCGDCGAASDCLSLEPVETPLGRKRRINQSSCNKDRSCVEGFCPSFVTVHGGSYRGAGSRSSRVAFDGATLPLPVLPRTDSTINILFAGVGGTGVVTASTLLAQAAQLAGKEVSVLDVTGLSQKYGGVQSHVRIAPAGALLGATRIATGQADVLIGCDLLVSAEGDVLTRLRRQQVKVAVNTAISPAADFTRNPDWQVDPEQALKLIAATGADMLSADASATAESELGDAIGANVLLLGMAWQRGWIPLSLDHMLQAIRTNPGAALNEKAFSCGRKVAHLANKDAVQGQPLLMVPRQQRTLKDWISLHQRQLSAYQGQALVDRYTARIQGLAQLESTAGHDGSLSQAAARGYFKLLAHKDEFEVARLLTDPAFHDGLKASFEGAVQIRAHLGGGWLSKRDPVTGKAVKRELRGWIWPALKTLSAMRRLRGSVLDPWRHNDERLLAKRWLFQYEEDLELARRALTEDCSKARHDLLCQLLQVPDRLRGFGHVREAHSAKANELRLNLLQSLGAPLMEPCV